MQALTPIQIVRELDRYIVGQANAKRAVAIALRNRWRRAQVAGPLQAEITPKNILMMGPTGVGKTEIARRLAQLANAPFLKVEATKFTEVGYVGRDVESIVRDLVDVSIGMFRAAEMEKVQADARAAAEETVLDALLPRAVSPSADTAVIESESPTRQKFRQRLRAGELDNREIEIELQEPSAAPDLFGIPGLEGMAEQMQGMFQNLFKGRATRRKLRIRDALHLLAEEHAGRLVNDEDIRQRAVDAAQNHGIVFIDEMDKICIQSDGGSGPDVSRSGVQRDLLPLVEGSTVNTKFGMVKTDHILFIAAGAFHESKPTDLIPELQGRFPIRVELDALRVEDFVRILSEPDASLTRQYTALLATEEVSLQFAEDGIQRIAQIAFELNEKFENIGARRLHTVLEKVLESVCFDSSERAGESVIVDRRYVNLQLDEFLHDEDLSRFIL